MLPLAAVAQDTGDRMLGCREASTQEDRDKLTLLRSYTLTSIAVSANNQLCRVHDRIVGIFADKDPDRIEIEDVVDAATPDVDPVLAEMERKRELNALEHKLKLRAEGERDRRRRSNPVDEAMDELNEREQAERSGTLPNYGADPAADDAAAAAREELRSQIYIVPEKRGGFINIFKGNGAVDPDAPLPESIEQLDGEGTLITPEGIKRGVFEGGELQGEGEEILNDGTWRFGNFDGGRMNDYGIVVGEGEDQEQIYIRGGMFRDDFPDGTFETTFEDGSSQMEIWEGGKLVATGPRAPKGAMAKRPEYKSAAELAMEAEQQFTDGLESEKNVGAMFALADELDASGDSDKARQAFRALIRRFPDSPLAASAAARLGGGGGGGASAPPASASLAPSMSGGGSARFSSVCMRDLTYLDEQAYRNGKRPGGSPGFYEGLISLSSRCASYDSEAREQQQIKTRERATDIRTSDAADPDLPWFREQTRRALNDPDYSASLGPYRLGPGGIGGGSGGQAGSSAPNSGGYQTQITDKILPESFHQQFAGRNLPIATCITQQEQNIGYVAGLPENGMYDGYRKIMAATEFGMAILRQCEQDYSAKRQLDEWQATRAQALENCEMVASSPGSCRTPIRR